MKTASAAVVAALVAIGDRGAAQHRLEPPGGTAHLDRPHRGRHGRLRVHGEGRARTQLTVVANWIPFEDPAGGPNFYRFDDRARYYINVDNTGDGKADVRYRFKFQDEGTRTRTRSCTRCRR